jgi:hypothetical protein
MCVLIQATLRDSFGRLADKQVSQNHGIFFSCYQTLEELVNTMHIPSKGHLRSVGCIVIALHLVSLVLLFSRLGAILRDQLFIVATSILAIPIEFFTILQAMLFVVGVALGIGVLWLSNAARLTLIVFHSAYVLLLFPSFLLLLIFGLYTGGLRGDDARWSSPLIPDFWLQLAGFTGHMLVFLIPIVLSVFFVFYFMRDGVRKQFYGEAR